MDGPITGTSVIEWIYRHRVRYRECDRMGVVYHTHYLDYFEAARTEALRALGVSYRSIEDDGIRMPVVEASIRYLRSAEYDDELEILTRFPEPPGVTISVDYEVRRRHDPALLATGRVVLCFLDAARGRPVRAPEAVRKLFASGVTAPQPKLT